MVNTVQGTCSSSNNGSATACCRLCERLRRMPRHRRSTAPRRRSGGRFRAHIQPTHTQTHPKNHLVGQTFPLGTVCPQMKTGLYFLQTHRSLFPPIPLPLAQKLAVNIANPDFGKCNLKLPTIFPELTAPIRLQGHTLEVCDELFRFAYFWQPPCPPNLTQTVPTETQ